ncbi:putative aminopyrimidine aminohydrolase, mitochondrial [Colletotrichum chlorophyti]|uniref:Putative aminopyrimidine aminohydrolase, mitochondrial n=1 Tax=Colletotrichum chlorophyti TaxID=708187 RepID=A0A1Q8S0Z6_9PEZI|nr:putative aminopyrimidine aminohydrolase, mitochondrial [Colletotrichum chlorophyti]
MPRRPLSLVLDFDGTITTKDTIGTLAEIGLRFQQQRGIDLSSTWQQILADYSRDHADNIRKYKPVADNRQSLTEELIFLRGLKEVELRSVERVEKSGIFRDITQEDLIKAGDEARREGRVKLRDGFAELMDTAKENGWSVSVVSVNWSRSFIQGVLSAYAFDVVANEIELSGAIFGPDIFGVPTRETIMTTCADKVQALRILVTRQRADDEAALVYFGDSTSDLECLLETRGVVISTTADSSLMKTLARVGFNVPRAKDRSGSSRIVWASTFEEVLGSGFLPLG